MQLTAAQIAKSVACAAIGFGICFAWFHFAELPMNYVVCIAGALIGVALTLPGVSVSNVASGVAVMTVARNVPSSLRGAVLETLADDKAKAPPPPSDKQPSDAARPRDK